LKEGLTKMNDLKPRVHLKIIDNRAYIKMINMRRLKKICALGGMSIRHESHNLPHGYYIPTRYLEKFTDIVTNAGIEVLILKEK